MIPQNVISAFEFLGLSPNATLDELKCNYRRMAFKMHPDRNKDDPNAEEKIKKLHTEVKIAKNWIKTGIASSTIGQQERWENRRNTCMFGHEFNDEFDFEDIYEEMRKYDTETKRRYGIAIDESKPMQERVTEGLKIVFSSKTNYKILCRIIEDARMPIEVRNRAYSVLNENMERIIDMMKYMHSAQQLLEIYEHILVSYEHRMTAANAAIKMIGDKLFLEHIVNGDFEDELKDAAIKRIDEIKDLKPPRKVFDDRTERAINAANAVVGRYVPNRLLIRPRRGLPAPAQQKLLKTAT